MFGTKEDYALRALVEMARTADGKPVQSHEVAQRQQIPALFMDQILLQLRRGGIVRSVRGAGGGFLLARPAGEIRVGDVLRALRGDIAIVKVPPAGESTAVSELWDRLQGAVEGVIEETTLGDLVERQEKIEASRAPMFYI